MHSPMEQFEIKKLLHLNLFGIDASFTNSATWMIIAVILATSVFVWGMRQRALVPGRLQSVAEVGYEFASFDSNSRALNTTIAGTPVGFRATDKDEFHFFKAGDVYDRHGSVASLRTHYNAHTHKVGQQTTSAPTPQD